ncbi:MAG: hypothetical protein Q8L48_17595 [Archangium sp.]|nr:hypothetical protein [Archangium sp.]
MRLLTCVCVLLSGAAVADSEVFHGWSKDGTWLVYEQRTHDDRVELYFCPTDPQTNPTWPAALHNLDREDGTLSCVRFLDPNKAPYQWKNLLVLPAPSMQQAGISISPELATDGESPGFTLVAGDKKQSCYASATREDSKLMKTWFHPSSRFVAAIIDGNFRHCVVTLKPTRAVKPPGGKKK